MRSFALLGAILGACSSSAQQPTAPTLCTSANKGRCDCANLAPASSPVSTGSTYIWFLDGEQRCFTTYNTGSSPRPTLLYLQCYGGDRLTAITPPAVAAADRFGFALAYLSSPDHAWSWNATVINDAHPRPCEAATAGEDYTYVADVLESLAGAVGGGWFDASRVYTYGFSQNGMASAYIGRCFSEQVLGCPGQIAHHQSFKLSSQ